MPYDQFYTFYVYARETITEHSERVHPPPPRQNQESIIMTICLRHDCILTERDECVGVKGHVRTPARIEQRKSAWCVGRANTHDEYVSFYKQDGTSRFLSIAHYFVFQKYNIFHCPSG